MLEFDYITYSYDTSGHYYKHTTTAAFDEEDCEIVWEPMQTEEISLKEFEKAFDEYLDELADKQELEKEIHEAIEKLDNNQ